MPYKSKLFQRNNAGKRQMVPASYSPRFSGGFRSANPKPKVSERSTQRLENKSITVAGALIIANDTGNVFHLDTIGAGTLASQRTGQKHQVTGVHLRGRVPMVSTTPYDQSVYYLVWDRSPNEIKPGFADIFQMASGIQACHAFPNNSNSERFIILARKAKNMTNADTANTTEYNESMQWSIDDYYSFSRKLIATSVTGGGSTISDRTSGALYLVAGGLQAGAAAPTMQIDYRLYFNDV